MASLGYIAKPCLKIKAKTTTEKENREGRGYFKANGLYDKGKWAEIW